jgi:hypothetical protein
MQIRDQLDECGERYGEQQAHHTPQPTPEENPNRCRHRPDAHAICDKFRNQEIRRYDMQEENRQTDDDVRSRCAELKERRRKRNPRNNVKWRFPRIYYKLLKDLVAAVGLEPTTYGL